MLLLHAYMTATPLSKNGTLPFRSLMQSVFVSPSPTGAKMSHFLYTTDLLRSPSTVCRYKRSIQCEIANPALIMCKKWPCSFANNSKQTQYFQIQNREMDILYDTDQHLPSILHFNVYSSKL